MSAFHECAMWNNPKVLFLFLFHGGFDVDFVGDATGNEAKKPAIFNAALGSHYSKSARCFKALVAFGASINYRYNNEHTLFDLGFGVIRQELHRYKQKIHVSFL